MPHATYSLPPAACHPQPDTCSPCSLPPAAIHPPPAHLLPAARHRKHTKYKLGLHGRGSCTPHTGRGCAAEPQVHQILAQAAWHCLKYTKYQQEPHGRASSIPNNRRGCMVEAQVHQIQQGLDGRGSNRSNTAGAGWQRLKYTKYWQGLR